MTQIKFNTVHALPNHSAQMLKLSGTLWFVIAIVGQWLFAFYVVAYFGVKLVHSGTVGLSETHLTGGHIPGDAVGNITIAAHLLSAIVIHGFGPLQLIPRIRSLFPAFHHWSGRAFIAAASIGAISGLYIVLIRGSGEGILVDATNSITAILILSFSFITIRHAAKRNLDAHHRWALRLFLITSAFWFVRLGVYASAYYANFTNISFREIIPTVFATVHIAKIIIPLSILELYLRSTNSSKSVFQYAVAGLITLSALLTSIAIYAVASMGWLPKIFG